MKKLPKVQVKTDYAKMQGGLDLETPALEKDPGSLIAGMNYVAGTSGGYSRIDGYERFDGTSAPSAGVYYHCPCTFTDGGPDPLDTITGVDSSETAVVVSVGADYINITKVSGDFNDDEIFNVGGSPKGTFTADQVLSGESSALLDATARNATADIYRADIEAPPGSGPIRGLCMLAGVLYCFVDNASGPPATAGLIYKSTAAGWSAITPGNEIGFTAGTGLISDGDTITGVTSGAHAVVSRVVLESGEWGTDAAGRLIIGTVTSGPFQAEVLNVSAIGQASSTGAQSAIAILPGGRYEMILYNFTGSTATRRIYGCDGVNRGFEFDGTVYVPINTGMSSDKPVHVNAYKNQLFFSFKGSSQNSGLGMPYAWTPLLGAAEIALGDDITGYSAEAQGLIICSRNSTHQLLGDSSETFVLDDVSPETGAIPYTIQGIGEAYALDDRGIINIKRVQEYGNFDMSTVSRKVQKRINTIRAVAVASSVYRAKNQYRIYGSDGTGICMTIIEKYKGFGVAFTEFKYPDNVSCVWTGEDAAGKDIVFFGSDQGMVYQADKGSSFDGEEIEAYLFLPFNNSKSPNLLKTYRYGTLEMTAELYCAIQFSAMLSYGDSSIAEHVVEEYSVAIDGGLWDVDSWGTFFYDNEIVTSPSFDLTGDGTNMSLSIYSKSDLDLGHKIDNLIFYYTPRRLI